MEPPGLPAGKLPNKLLAELLRTISHRDPRVVAGPKLGRDAAVIDLGGPGLLVATTDPITFASEEIGRYAVHVNANDVACMGARPAWFLASVLLPEGCPAELPAAIQAQMVEACESLGVELVGGHTEVTVGLDRPIVVGFMLGEVARDRLVRAERSRPGDAVILTTGIALEGTAVLAREARDGLLAAGVPAATLDRATRFLEEPGISVVLEALAVAGEVPVRAMHDPTEGGLATALYELAGACGTGVAVNEDAVVVLPETEAICRALGLEPLGLLASGALLVVVTEEDCARALGSLGEIGVAAARIGSLVAAEDGVIMMGNGEPRPVPRFARDELARFLSD